MKLGQLARDLGYALAAAVTTPKGAAGTERLDQYWTEGAGAAKIQWEVPCAFCRCLTELGKYVNPTQLKGHCARLEKRATGHRPNVENSRTRHCPC